MIQVMAMFKDLQTDSESDVLDGISLKNTVIEERQEKQPQLMAFESNWTEKVLFMPVRPLMNCYCSDGYGDLNI